MSYFEEMTQKAKEVVATAAEKAKVAADSAKISAEIIREKRELDAVVDKFGYSAL